MRVLDSFLWIVNHIPKEKIQWLYEDIDLVLDFIKAHECTSEDQGNKL
jgi:hypothetical protein